MILKIKLVKFERALGFQVLHMDEKYRGIGTVYSDPCCSLRISSENAVQLTNGAIYIRGRLLSEDLCVCSSSFYDNEKRDEYFENLLHVLRQWAESTGVKKEVGEYEF